jgi:hypothetical protein
MQALVSRGATAVTGLAQRAQVDARIVTRVAIDVVNFGCWFGQACLAAEPAQRFVGQHGQPHLAPSGIVATGMSRTAFAIQPLLTTQP